METNIQNSIWILSGINYGISHVSPRVSNKDGVIYVLPISSLFYKGISEMLKRTLSPENYKQRVSWDYKLNFLNSRVLP